MFYYINIRLIFLFTFCLSSTNTIAQWKLVYEKDDTRVFNKPSENGMSFYKVETIINSSISDLYTFFTNFSDYPLWVSNCSYVKVLRQIPDSNYIYYSYFDMPWPATDRDGVSDLTIDFYGTDSIVVSSVPSKHYIPLKNNVIRVDNFKESYTLTKLTTNSVFLSMEGGYDPGGFIPEWLIKKMLKYGPYDVVIRIKKLVE